jgi:hypothetical protein
MIDNKLTQVNSLVDFNRILFHVYFQDHELNCFIVMSVFPAMLLEIVCAVDTYHYKFRDNTLQALILIFLAHNSL